MLIEPFLGMSAAEAAFEMGATPEEAEEARRRGAALLDFEVSSPTGLRYKEAVKGGLGQLGQYLMDEGSTGSNSIRHADSWCERPFPISFPRSIDPRRGVTEGALRGVLEMRGASAQRGGATSYREAL